MVEQKRKMEEERRALEKAQKKAIKAQQDVILNRKGNRARLSFSVTPKAEQLGLSTTVGRGVCVVCVFDLYQLIWC